MYHPNDAGIGTDTPLGDAAATEQLIVDYYDGKSTPEDRARVGAYLRSQGQPLEPAWNTSELLRRDREYFAHHFLPVYWSQVQAQLDRLAGLARERRFTVIVAILPEEHQRINGPDIIKHVARHYGLKVTEIKSKSNARQIAFPRQVAMYLCKKLTELSYPEIGKLFNDKHHSTVMYSVDKIDQLRAKDADLDRTVQVMADHFAR
jgi:hypothetical protein